MSTPKPDQIRNQPVDDRGTNETEGRAILKRLRDRAFERSDEKLSVALGRPLAEVEGGRVERLRWTMTSS
ncbi:MAG: hypothetical protein ACREBC_03205 [Pyrinomonadaceae bacterium]